MKKRVVIISETAGTGVGRYIMDVLENLDMEKFEAHLIYFPLRMDTRFENWVAGLGEKGVRIYKVVMKREISPIGDIRALFSIISLLVKIRPHVVHCNSSKAGALGRLGASAALCKNIIYTPHAYVFQDWSMKKSKRDMYVRIERMLSKFCDVVINVSEDERDAAVDEGVVEVEKTRVVPNGVDAKRFRKRDRKWLNDEFGIGDVFLAGSVARATRQKDPVAFVRVAARIAQTIECGRVMFMYVGDGELLEDAIFEAEKLGIAEKIVFTGFRLDVERILPCFDMFISTSIYEGLPYSILEAMAAGVPVVATNVTGSRQILEGDCGVLLPVGNYLDMADWAVKIMLDEKLSGEFSQRAYGRVKREYSIEHMVRQTEKIYLER